MWLTEKGKMRDKRKWFDSCDGTRHDCWKIVVIETRLEYLSSSLKLENPVLRGEQFLKRGYSEAIVKDFFVFKIFIKSSAVNCTNTFDQDCSF